MQIQITGKQIDVGAALQEHIAAGLEERVSKYFDRTGEGVVTVSKPGWAFYVDCSVHLPSGVTLQAHGEGDDAYVAFEHAVDRMEKRVRRYKNRLKSHRGRDAMPMELAAERVIRADGEGDANGVNGFDGADDLDGVNGVDLDGALEGDAPAIVAEANTSIRTMTVSMAVMQLELADSPALMFRNAAHGGLNMVYRRPDGNLGWVDPGIGT